MTSSDLFAVFFLLQSSLTKDCCFYSICPETKSAKSGELVVLACITMIYNKNFTGISSRLLRSWRAQPDPFSFSGPNNNALVSCDSRSSNSLHPSRASGTSSCGMPSHGPCVLAGKGGQLGKLQLLQRGDWIKVDLRKQ